MSSTRDKATSATVSAARHRASDRVLALRSEDLRLSAGEVRDACQAGANPKPSPVAVAIAAAAPNTVQSRLTVSKRGMLCGAAATRARIRIRPRRIPAAQPAAASSMLSARNCRTIRIRPAPSAKRTLISCRRPTALTKSRLATLTQVISTINPDAPNKARRESFTFCTRSSRNGAIRARIPRLVFGILLLESDGDGVELLLRGLQRNSGLESSHYADFVIASGSPAIPWGMRRGRRTLPLRSARNW